MSTNKFKQYLYRFLKLAAAVFLAITAILSLNGCRNAAQAQSLPPSPQANVETPNVKDVPVVYSVPGYVEAIDRVELRSRVSGYLDKVLFTDGALVAQGQILFLIDRRPYQAALNRAEALLQKAKINANRARLDSERANHLSAQKAISKEETQRRQTEAAMALLEVAAAEAAADAARLDLQFTEIRAPISGRIGRAQVTSGNLVNANHPLAVIVATDAMYVRFGIDENTFAAHGVENRAKWEVKFDLPTGKSVQAEMVFIDNEVNSSTGTLTLRARISNLNGQYLPGQFGNVTLTLSHQRDALLISEQAIGTDQGQRYVLALTEKNTLEVRPVTLGVRVGNQRVVEKGLTREDRIVASGLMRLRPGMTVIPHSVQDDVAVLKLNREG